MSVVEMREVLPQIRARLATQRERADVGGAGLRRDMRDRYEPTRGAGTKPVGSTALPTGGEAVQPGTEGKTDVRGDDGSVRGTTQPLDLWKRLLNHLGGGERPELRIMLFQRVQRLVEQHGLKMETLVREALTQAKGKRSPAHYFCRAIRAKINEAGFLEELP